MSESDPDPDSDSDSDSDEDRPCANTFFDIFAADIFESKVSPVLTLAGKGAYFVVSYLRYT